MICDDNDYPKLMILRLDRMVWRNPGLRRDPKC